MKKVVLILLCVIIVGLVYFYLLNKNKEIIHQEEIVIMTPTKETKEVKVGNLVLNIPEELEIIKSNRYALSIKIPGVYAEKNEVDSRIQKKYNYLIFSFYENTNLDRKSAQEWFLSESSKEAGIVIDPPDNEFILKVGNFDAYKTIHGSLNEFVDTTYYNREQTYIPNKTDIYEIVSYRKADTKEIQLTPEEQKSIENYEKIVDQIIQSIRFVN